MRKSLTDFASPLLLSVFLVLFPTHARAVVVEVSVKGNSANYKFNFRKSNDTLEMRSEPPGFPQGGDDRLSGSITFKFSNPGPPPATKDIKFKFNDLTKSDGAGLLTPDDPIPAGFDLIDDPGKALVSNDITVLPKSPTKVPAPLPLLGVGAAFNFSRRLRKMLREVKFITPD